MIKKYIKFLSRYSYFILLFAIILSIVSFYSIKRIQLKSSFVDLLPSDIESVKNLEKVTEIYGGIGDLIVAVETTKPQKIARLFFSIAKKLEKLDEVRFVDFRLEKEFFDEHQLLYLDLNDLKEIRRRIRKKIKLEKKKANPFYIDLLEEEYKLDFKDIESKYKNKRKDRRFNEFYIGDSGNGKKLVIMLIKPNFISSSLGNARILVKKVKKVLDESEIKKVDPDAHIGMTGRYKKTIDDNEVIKKDIFKTSILAFILILLFTVIFFRKFSAIFYIMLPLAMGLIWTYGLTGITLGHINIITGFLIAIIGGLGIDYGVHLLSRYRELRGSKSTEESLTYLFQHTGYSVFLAAVTTIMAFSTLILARFKGFSEFGIISSTGMILCIIAYYTVFPSMIIIAERHFSFLAPGVKKSDDIIIPPFVKRIVSSSPYIILVFIYLIFSILAFNKIPFEYDFSKLQGRNLESYKLDKRINEIFGISLTPAVIIPRSIKEEREISKYIKNKIKKYVNDTTFDLCLSMDDFIPKNQTKKMKILRLLKKDLSDDILNALDRKQKKEIDKLKKKCSVGYVTRRNLPLSIKDTYQGIHPEKMKAGVILVFPKVNLAKSKAIFKYAEEIKDIQHRFKGVPITGETEIVADILNLIIQDGKIILTLSLLIIFLIVIFNFKNVYDSFVVLSSLIFGIIGMFGIMWIFGIKFNFLNVIIFPVLLGIGIDSGIHIYRRYLEEGKKDIFESVKHAGPPVFVSAVTTMMGFSALVIANHQGLKTIGILAIAGMISILFFALTGIPALVLLKEKIKFKMMKRR